MQKNEKIEARLEALSKPKKKVEKFEAHKYSEGR